MRNTIAILGAMMFFLTLETSFAKPVMENRDMLKTFDYQGVTLGAGRLRWQVEDVREYYLRIPNDDLLKPYRQRAGLDAPGHDLGGVYVGHGAFGQYLSGLARFYAATGDEACLEKAQALLAGWAECIEPDGFCLQEKSEGVMALAPYHFEKLVGGLVDLYVYGGFEEALDSLNKIGDWATSNILGVEKNINVTEGNWYMLNGEWYTLAENMYRAAAVTGNEKYLTMAKAFEYTDFWNLVADGKNVFDRPDWKGWYHAYSHVNSFCGAGAAYEATGDAHYLDVLKKAHDFVTGPQGFVTGGFGPNETLMPREDLVKTLESSKNHFETQCGSWAAFKICKYLTRFTGEARYGDWVERLLINGIGASIPSDSEGRVFYYSSYHMDEAKKTHVDAGWPCCSGTRIEATADYHDLIFYHDADALYVSQFAPASVRWPREGGAVTLTQATRFPYASQVELTVETKSPSAFALCVRRPGWLSGEPTATVNGEAIAVQTDERGWMRFDRTWSDGDVLRVDLPMAIGVAPISEQSPWPAAITIGPVVLAARCAEGDPAKKIDWEHLAQSLREIPGQPLNFRPEGAPDVLLRPFLEFEQDEPYKLYLDPTREVVTKTNWHGGIYYGGEWFDSDIRRATNKPGAYASFPFEGTGVRIHAQRYDDCGRFLVSIDDKVVGVMDQYGPVRGVDDHWDFAGLEPGPHLIKMVLMAEKGFESKGNFGNIISIEVLGAKKDEAQ